MVGIERAPKGNRLLQALSAQDRSLLSPHLVRGSFKVRETFERPNRPIQRVYFLDTGIASVVAEHPDGRRIEIGIIGSEGMTGTAIVLGSDRTPHSCYIQVTGEGHSIPVAAIRQAMRQSPSMQAGFLKFVQAFTVQTAHTAIANARASLQERLARWLLMAQDRIAGDTLNLTHEFLALMMAVRRAGVTEALQALEDRKLIECRRSQIILLNRKGIEKIAGHFYGTPEAEYRRLLG
jgi:CRP-like cAMP-binding protein